MTRQRLLKRLLTGTILCGMAAVASPGFAEATQVQRVIEAVMVSGDKEQWVDVEDSKI